MGETAIVVGDRKELTYLLSQAAELEHGLMCEYLYAAFSLKNTAGPGPRSDQLAAVERRRGMILGIAGEEMLHWAMVQNLLTAVGSAPYDKDQKPSHGCRVVTDSAKDLGNETTHSTGANSAVRHDPPLMCEYRHAPVVLR